MEKNKNNGIDIKRPTGDVGPGMQDVYEDTKCLSTKAP